MFCQQIIYKILIFLEKHFASTWKSDKLLPGNNWRYFYLKTFSCIIAIRAWLKIKIFDIRIFNCAQVSIIFSTFLVQLVFLHTIIFHFSYFYYQSFSLQQQRWHREPRCYVHVKCRSNPKDCGFERWRIGAAVAVMAVELAVTDSIYLRLATFCSKNKYRGHEQTNTYSYILKLINSTSFYYTFHVTYIESLF